MRESLIGFMSGICSTTFIIIKLFLGIRMTFSRIIGSAVIGIVLLNNGLLFGQSEAIDGDSLFDAERIVEVKIELAEADWDLVRKQTRNIMGFFSGASLESPYTYVKADIWIDGVKIESVGVRKKGLFGSQDSERPSLKIKFDEYVEQEPVKGLTRLTLNNNKQDTSQVSQLITYKLFRDAGVHASRCNLAHVTVNGKNLGVYSNVESVKRTFLARSFGDDSGNLYEGTITDFHPKTVEKIEVKTNKKENKRQELTKLAELLSQDDPESLAAIEQMIDLDNFYRFWAMEGLIRFWDGYASNQNNYFVYFDPGSDKAYFLPWGADSSFSANGGPFARFNQNGGGQPANTSIYSNGYLAHRLYHSEGGEQRYKETLKKLLEDVWNEDELVAAIDQQVKLYEPYLCEAQRRAIKSADDVKEFITKRRATVLKEIEDWRPTIAVEPRKPMYTIQVGSAEGTFDAEWSDEAPNEIEEIGSTSIGMRIGDEDVEFERLGVNAHLFQMRGFGRGRGGPAFVPPVSLIFRGERKSDGETWTLTLNVDAENFKKTDEAIEVFGFFAQGKGGFGRGFGGNTQSINGTITLTDSGQEDGDRIAGNLSLKIVEIHGGMFNRRLP